MKKILVILLIFALVFSTSVFAENIYDMQQNKDWVDKELESTIYQRKEYESSKDYYEGISEQVSDSLIAQNEHLLEKEGTIEALDKKINGFIDTIAATELEYQDKLALLKKRIIEGYIDSKVNLLTILTDSENITEFYEKLEIRKFVALYDQELMDELETLAIDLADKKARAEALQIQYQVALKTTEAAIGNLESIRVLADKTAKMSAEQIAFLQKREDDLMLESDRLLEVIREMQQKMDYAGGDMIWPVPANRSALDPGDFYGMRMHPIFHEWRMHTGIDIGAPTGANILAANSGTVIMAEYSSGYGNKIVVDHGGGIVTLYAHCSKIIAKVGQKVDKGQVIALIGSTGWATGPHLHFEVMEDGERHDPLEYVNQKSGT